MFRFAVSPLVVLLSVAAPCTLPPRLAVAEQPAAANPFDTAEPGAVAERTAANGFANTQTVASPFDDARSAASGDDPTPRLERKIRQALEGPTLMDFTETPLQDALDYLKDHHGIEIQLDMRALADEGIGVDTPITRMLHGVSLASALHLLLDDIDSTFVVRGGVLLITTKDAAERMADLRVYDIGELVSSEADAHELAEVLRSVFTDASVSRHGALASRGADSDGTTAATPHRAAQPAASRFDVLPFRNLLIVQASQHDHEVLAQLLDQIKSRLKSDK